MAMPLAALALLPKRVRAQAQAVAATGGDPLGSLLWPDLKREFVGNAPCQFTDLVSVRGPAMAEDAMHVPVWVDARAMAAQRAVRRIRIVVDRNPIRHVLDFEPLRAEAVLGLRLRMQQASPVRALVETVDGHWHVAGTWVQAAGGGCTVAGASRVDGSWSQTLNQVQARLFGVGAQGSRRLRLRIMHPMDTGFVPGVPAFLLESLSLSDAHGRPLWRMALHEPVAENPLMTLELPPDVSGPLRLQGADNNGNPLDVVVPA
ncbi:MAG: hypothetical protein RI907_486 [Pseudomonadota bacterium]|jgi:sulfur-oxidizing protein SoxY